MKTLIISCILACTFHASIAQKTHINCDYIDTTRSDVKSILSLWESYIEAIELNSPRFGNHTFPREVFRSFWSTDAIDNYEVFDLQYSIVNRYYKWFYYGYDSQYILGIAQRDSTHYELKTMFVKQDGFPSIIMNIPIEKKHDTFLLQNKFSSKLKELAVYELENIRYFYSQHYPFDSLKANHLQHKTSTFINAFELDKQTKIQYFIGSSFSEVFQWFGIDYFFATSEYALEINSGMALFSNNMVISANSGEAYFHEVIHALLHTLDYPESTIFEEGIACYFGLHSMKPFSHHAPLLLEYLNSNQWIDLSKGIERYFLDEENRPTYTPTNKPNWYTTPGVSNHTYIIQATICAIAFEKGGYPKVKQIYRRLSEEILAKENQSSDAANLEHYFRVIFEELGIPRFKIQQVLKDYISKMNIEP